MDLKKDSVLKIFLTYLRAAFFSTMISSIYGVVDMAVVGQYQGPEGTAALAVVAPVWNLIYSLGLLVGVGGSVLLSVSRGRGEEKAQNEYFTVAFIGAVTLSVIAWLTLIFAENQMLILFGADSELLPLAKEYLLPVKFTVPVFIFTQLFAAFLRNDDNPSLAARAVLCGGIFNVFGDIFCVFTLDMGIMGAGLATSIGAIITLIIMLTHFKSKKNTMKFTKPTRLANKAGKIIITGFSSFLIDVAMGILTTFFNRQIMRYLGTDALSVYGVIVNISTIVQCCAYSVGSASQPLFSVNFGAGNGKRLRQTLRYAAIASAVLGVVWTCVIWAIPNAFIKIFMSPTEAILGVAPSIMRTYAISFLLLPFNVFSTYYYQAILKPAYSFAVSLLRGVIISGAAIYLLPALLGANFVWCAMPLTELIIFIPVCIHVLRSSKTVVG